MRYIYCMVQNGGALVFIAFGGSQHQEYWIPAVDTAVFNQNIVGSIEVIAEFWPYLLP